MNHQYRLKWRNKNSIKWNTESTVYTSLESINVHIESCKKNVPEMEYFIEHREVSNWEAITNVPNDDNSKVKELLDLISKGNCCHKEYCHYAKATDIVLKECGEDMNENTIARACHRIKSDTSKGFCEDYNFGICKTAENVIELMKLV